MLFFIENLELFFSKGVTKLTEHSCLVMHRLAKFLGQLYAPLCKHSETLSLVICKSWVFWTIKYNFKSPSS